jgi:hypothetical protein
LAFDAVDGSSAWRASAIGWLPIGGHGLEELVMTMGFDIAKLVFQVRQFHFVRCSFFVLRFHSSFFVSVR